MMSWNALPNELRRQVWSFMTYEGKNLDDGGEISCEWRRNRADLANCALVNRQWQGIFEEAMFKNIFLTQETVQSLRKITQRQKKLVRYIWLKIAIDSLPCRSCPDYDLACGTVSSLDHVAAGLCMLRFLFILSSWKRDELGCPEGLTIELSCFSPEDAQHSFRNDLFFDSSPFADEIQLGGNRVPLNYVEHGTINGRRAAPLDTNNIIKLFHDDIDLPSPDHCDPATGVVDVVSRLVIRRQTRRHLDPFLMQRIIEALPELTEVTYEPWRDWRESDQDSSKSPNPFEAPCE